MKNKHKSAIVALETEVRVALDKAACTHLGIFCEPGKAPRPYFLKEYMLDVARNSRTLHDVTFRDKICEARAGEILEFNGGYLIVVRDEHIWLDN